MKHLLRLILISGLGVISLPTEAQDAELQEKYWSYRHRLRTEFMKIGKGDGHSIPAENRNMLHGCGGIYGKYQTGDATLNLGEYIATLATEYKLLNDANQDVTATANELYYALNAVNRLDLFGEEYFSEDGEENGFFVRDDWPADMFKQITANEVDENGVLLADPIKDHHSLSENLFNFQLAHREEGPIPSNDYRAEWPTVKVEHPTHPSWGDVVYTVDRGQLCDFARDDWNRPIENKRANEMSQDQVYGLIMGFYAVKKFVPSDAGAMPNPAINDKYINFHAWVEVLCDRMLTFVSKQKTVRDATVILNEDDEYRLVTFDKLMTTWFINNPSNGDKQVERGMNMWLYAAPLARIGKEITGKTYSTDIVIHLPKAVDRGKVLFKTSFIGFPQMGCIGSLSQKAEKLDADGKEFKTMDKIVPCGLGGAAGLAAHKAIKSVLLPLTLYTAATGDIKVPNAEDLWKIALFQAAKSEIGLGSQMTIKLAAMDPKFNKQDLDGILINKALYTNGRFDEVFEDNVPMFYNLFPNAFHSSNWPKPWNIEQRDFLNTAPCEGTGKTQTRAADADFPTIWMHGDLFSLNKQTHHRDSLLPDETGGMGFMLAHNLYRIAYAADISNTFRPEHCPCESTALIRHRSITNENSLAMDSKQKLSELGLSNHSRVEVTPRQFSNYADIGIPKPFYVSHDVEIKNQGLLRVAGDLTVCGSEMEVKANGEVFIPNTDPDYPTTMEVDNGGRVSFEPNSRLTIGNKSKLLIGSAGVLELFRDVTITLDGPEANLVIEGELILRDNAKLTIQGGQNGLGFVTFRKGTNPDNGNETFAKITPGVNSSIELIGSHMNAKLLEIDGSFGVIVPENLTSFSVKNGAIELGKMSRISVACPVKIENCHFNTINRSNSYEYFAGLLTAGQEVSLRNCTFEKGIFGVLSHNFIQPGKNPRLLGCRFNDMNTPIEIRGGGVDLTAVKIENSVFNIKATGLYKLSTLKGVDVKGGKLTMFSGSSSGIIDWTKGTVSASNADGLTLFGNTLKPTCMSIQSNSRNGIYAKRLSHISLSTLANDGYNSISLNRTGIYSKDMDGPLNGPGISNGASLDLVDGYNDISHNGIQLDLIAKPTWPINGPGGQVYVPSSNNYWGMPNPVKQVDYTIIHKPTVQPVFSYANLGLIPQHLATSVSIHTEIDNVCASNSVVVGGGNGSDRDLEPQLTEPIDTTDGSGTTFGEVLNDADKALYKTGNYIGAREKYQIILLHDFPESTADIIETVKNRVYKNYFVAQEYLLATDSNNAIDRVRVLTESIAMIDAMLESDAFEVELSNEFIFNLKMDKADLYRAKNNRPVAVQLYDDLLTDPELIESYELIDYHRCIASGEQEVIEGNVTLNEYAINFSCSPPFSDDDVVYMEAIDIQDNVSSSTETEIEYTMSMFPNPTNGAYTVSVDDDFKAAYGDQLASLIISDAYGLPIQEFENIDINGSIDLSLAGYKAGIYALRLSVADQLLTGYVVLTDQ